MSKIKIGDIVQYTTAWCTPNERRYLHVVKENLLNPVTGQMTRWLIETINSTLTLRPQEVVDDYMIESTGFNIENYKGEQQ